MKHAHPLPNACDEFADILSNIVVQALFQSPFLDGQAQAQHGSSLLKLLLICGGSMQVHSEPLHELLPHLCVCMYVHACLHTMLLTFLSWHHTRILHIASSTHHEPSIFNALCNMG